MSNKQFDPTKPVRTRDGRPARILMADRKTNSTFRIVALVETDGAESLDTYDSDGFITGLAENAGDLVNCPPPIKRTVWMNIYPVRDTLHGRAEDCSVFPTRSLADEYAAHHRIACIEIHIDTEEGAGLTK